MTPAEKKRFIWVMILILFFFADLIIGAILVLHVAFNKTAAGGPATAPAAMTAPTR